MEVQCPQCRSRFNLPDNLARPGARLRCSVCRHVFPLAARDTAVPEAAPKAGFDPRTQYSVYGTERSGTGRFRGCLLVLVLLCVLGGGAAWWYWDSLPALPAFLQGEEQQKDKAKEPAIADEVSLLTMRNVRQFFVQNEKVGRICVVMGDVRNEFPDARALIRVEATLYDGQKKPLAIKTQLAGAQLSLFQLQVLGEKEMESFLQSGPDIFIRNGRVPSGGEVPFMVLFYAPPDEVAEFAVRIAGVEEPAPQAAPASASGAPVAPEPVAVPPAVPDTAQTAPAPLPAPEPER